MGVQGVSTGLLRVPMLAAAAAVVSFGQTAQLSGRAMDPYAGAIPGVDIVVANTETGIRRRAVTNPDGYYSVAMLQPGPYRLLARKDGFQPASREGIVLHAADVLTVDLPLQIGIVTQQITVTAELRLLRTGDAQTGQVIDHRRIEELPQYNRNVLAFAQLAAGVNGTSDQPGADMYGNVADFRINGGRTTQSEYVIDGVAVTDGYTHSVPASVPSPEAVQEMKVVTNGLSAEYGRLSGGIVVLATRSGANQYHGAAYEYFKNQLLNANDWNSNRYGRPKGTFHNNIPGASLGGPVRMPKVYNGRDKTFFFFNYEGNRFSSGSNAALASVPTGLERQGDFSRSLTDQGRAVQVYDPNTGTASGNETIRRMFPGNRIPASLISPIAKIYNSYYPEPNQAPLPGSSHDSNYIGSSTSSYRNDRFTGRIDQNWARGQMTYFTVTKYTDHQGSPGWLGPLSPSNSLDQNAYNLSFHHIATLGPAMVLEARLGGVRNEGPGQHAMFGSPGYASLPPAIDSSRFGFDPLVTKMLGTTVGRAPIIAISGDSIAGLGGGGGAMTFETDYNAGVSLQKQLGIHSLKFGWEHRRYYTNQYTGGQFLVSSERSVTQRNPLNFDGSGSGYASYLLGLATWGTGNQWAGPASLQTYYGAYAQDDIRLTPRTALNLGLRWDFEPPRTERYNREIFWDSKYKWDVQPAAGWSWSKALQQAGVTDAIPRPTWMSQGFLGRPAQMGSAEYPQRSIQVSYPYHFSPHVGLAYQLRPQRVVRLSYGLNWMSLTGNPFMNGTWNSPYGDTINIQRGTSDNGLTYPRTFQNPAPGGDGYRPAAHGSESEAVNAALGSWYAAEDTNTSAGYEHVFQLSLQQSLGAGAGAWILEANFSANLGRDLPFWLGRGELIMPNAYNLIGKEGLKLNAPVDNPVYPYVQGVPGSWANNAPQTTLGRVLTNNPLFAEAWTGGGPYGTSNYTAAYLQAEHRFGNGFSLLVNYTFSKLLQDVGSRDGMLNAWDNNGFPQAGLSFHDVYGAAPDDRTHRFLANYSIDVPFGRERRFLGHPRGFGAVALDTIVGGWTIAGTTTYRSGTPLVPFSGYGNGNFWANIGQGRQPLRPVFLNAAFDNNVGGHTALIGSANSTPYINPSSFAVPQGAAIGDVPATMSYFRGPGFSQWDIAILKKIGLRAEGRYVQFRAEAQNAFNHMNAANPDQTITGATFGYILGAAGTPRVVMLSARFVF